MTRFLKATGGTTEAPSYQRRLLTNRESRHTHAATQQDSTDQKMNEQNASTATGMVSTGSLTAAVAWVGYA